MQKFLIVLGIIMFPVGIYLTTIVPTAGVFIGLGGSLLASIVGAYNYSKKDTANKN